MYDILAINKQCAESTRHVSSLLLKYNVDSEYRTFDSFRTS